MFQNIATERHFTNNDVYHNRRGENPPKNLRLRNNPHLCVFFYSLPFFSARLMIRFGRPLLPRSHNGRRMLESWASQRRGRRWEVGRGRQVSISTAALLPSSVRPKGFSPFCRNRKATERELPILPGTGLTACTPKEAKRGKFFTETATVRDYFGCKMQFWPKWTIMAVTKMSNILPSISAGMTAERLSVVH